MVTAVAIMLLLRSPGADRDEATEDIWDIRPTCWYSNMKKTKISKAGVGAIELSQMKPDMGDIQVQC